MIKVKMLARHTGPTGKMEQGFEYLLSPDYATELVKHGLAVWVLPEALVEIVVPPVKLSTPKARFKPQGKK
jgi:hypothetical protein